MAEGKVRHLLECGGRITLISPKATQAIREWASQGKITWHKREYTPGDLKGAFLAIAATNQTNVNQAIADEAEAKAVLLNVVDHPALGGFIAPAVVRRGEVTLAISTGGASPALARKLREALEQSELLDYAELAPLLARARKKIKAAGFHVTPERWQQCIDKELVHLVRQGRESEAIDRLLHGLAQGEKVP